MINHFSDKSKENLEKSTNQISHHDVRHTQTILKPQCLISSPGITPNYKFDTGGLVIWLSRSTDIIPPKIRDEISWHRYQMDHANTILETYYVFIRLWNGGIEKAHIQKQDINEIIERLRTIQENTARHIEALRRL